MGDDLAEIDTEQSIQAGVSDLKLPEDCVDKAQELVSNLIQGSKAKSSITAREVMFLMQTAAPRLNEREAREALERLQEVVREGPDGDLNMVETLKQIVVSEDLSKWVDQPKAHDLL